MSNSKVKQVLSEVKGEPHLHVDSNKQHDASAPKIDATAYVGAHPMKGVMAEVQYKQVTKEVEGEHALKPAGHVRDASAPKVLCL